MSTKAVPYSQPQPLPILVYVDLGNGDGKIICYRTLSLAITKSQFDEIGSRIKRAQPIIWNDGLCSTKEV